MIALKKEGDAEKKGEGRNAIERGVEKLTIQVVQPQRTRNEKVGLEEEVQRRTDIDQDHEMTKASV